ncbi:MAG: lytic murein transglycosylase B [Casimicrobiaceae bacterium]
MISPTPAARRIRRNAASALTAARRLWLPALLALCLAPGAAAAQGAGSMRYDQRPETQAFIAELAADDAFDRGELGRLFAQASYQPKVVAAMSRPVLAPPKWNDYAPQFLNPERIEAGLDFWRANAAALRRAQAEFGIPPEVIVAIIGVETYYGRNTGGYRVFDALTTLAFDYPRRADFFRNELKQFLLLTRDRRISPLLPRGSYAGASGLPQFMPGSMRAYAVDYDGDGRIDLTDDPADAIGSVANFLARHDWQPGGRVLARARIDPQAGEIVARSLDGGISERRSLDAWARDGVGVDAAPSQPASDPAGLLMLEEADGPSYWLTFGNWYVLTRYNRSRLYATAVWQLAQALRAAWADAQRVDATPPRPDPAVAASPADVPASAGD